MRYLVLTALTGLLVCTQTPSLFAGCGKCGCSQEEACDVTNRKERPCRKAAGIAAQIKIIRTELEALSAGSSQENLNRLISWVDLLDEKVISYRDKAADKLEKLQNNEDATPRVKHKIRGCQDKMEAFDELSKIIGLLKAEILNKSQDLS